MAARREGRLPVELVVVAGGAFVGNAGERVLEAFGLPRTPKTLEAIEALGREIGDLRFMVEELP